LNVKVKISNGKRTLVVYTHSQTRN